jgi:adenine-specific DNA methylase
MLNRYLGNKTSMLEPILAAVEATTPSGGRVGDLFAGSMTVSAALKQAGYNVVSNDINHFSSIYGRAFIVNSTIPEFDIGLIPSKQRSKVKKLVRERLEELRGNPGFAFLEEASSAASFDHLARMIEFMNVVQVKDLPTEYQSKHFFDTYTDGGAHSAFKSLRGTKGRRRFFSGENALRLDAALNLMRFWFRTGAISEDLLAIGLATVCRAAERVGNIQGTWHDFPREWTEPRALNTIRFTPPPMDMALTGGKHVVGLAEDSLEFARRCPPLDTLYLDPPYNFRQYTSYYFLPNTITRYPYLDDPDTWFSQVKHVRGQNMELGFDSSFCKKHQFIPSLQELIERVPTKHVILSYFNGRNHWNDFKKEANGVGLNMLTEFFESELFMPGSLKIVPVERTNYQSYIGYTARKIDEYLFIARKHT